MNICFGSSYCESQSTIGEWTNTYAFGALWTCRAFKYKIHILGPDLWHFAILIHNMLCDIYIYIYIYNHWLNPWLYRGRFFYFYLFLYKENIPDIPLLLLPFAFIYFWNIFKFLCEKWILQATKMHITAGHIEGFENHEDHSLFPHHRLKIWLR